LFWWTFCSSPYLDDSTFNILFPVVVDGVPVMVKKNEVAPPSPRAKSTLENSNFPNAKAAGPKRVSRGTSLEGQS
jgi:hypothetical protein